MIFLGIAIGLWLGVYLCLVICGGAGIVRAWLLPFAALALLLLAPVLVIQSLCRRKVG